MKVKCLRKTAGDLPEALVQMILGKGADRKSHIFPLVVEKEYTAYGLSVQFGYLWYYICDEHFTYYPTWNPSLLFEISDGTLPTCWKAGEHSLGVGRESFFIMSFPEWVDDRLYYDKLTDGDAKAVQIFQRYRRIFENEVTD